MALTRDRATPVQRGSRAGLVAYACAAGFAFSFAGSAISARADEPGAIRSTMDKTTDGFEDAALAPLTDLNLRREGIPDALRDMTTPYSRPFSRCDLIGAEIMRLDDMLGADVDAAAPMSVEDEDTISDWASDEFSDFALDTVRGATTDMIPFRSLVRRATGAKRHDKKVRRAFERGLQRRAFLKGYGMALGCEPPAAPRNVPTVTPLPDHELYGDLLAPPPPQQRSPLTSDAPPPPPQRIRR